MKIEYTLYLYYKLVSSKFNEFLIHKVKFFQNGHCIVEMTSKDVHCIKTCQRLY